MNHEVSLVKGETVKVVGVSPYRNPVTMEYDLIVRPCHADADGILGKSASVSEVYLDEILQQDSIESTSDARVKNNVMRHNYRTLSDEEKEIMKTIKDKGLDFLTYLDDVGESRELSLAKTKIEEAVMWAVKHVTK